MFIPVCRHHFFKIQLYVLLVIQAQQCIRPSDIVLRWSDLTNPRAELARSTDVVATGVTSSSFSTCKTFGNNSSCPETLFSMSSTLLGTFISDKTLLHLVFQTQSSASRSRFRLWQIDFIGLKQVSAHPFDIHCLRLFEKKTPSSHSRFGRGRESGAELCEQVVQKRQGDRALPTIQNGFSRDVVGSLGLSLARSWYAQFWPPSHCDHFQHVGINWLELLHCLAPNALKCFPDQMYFTTTSPWAR